MQFGRSLVRARSLRLRGYDGVARAIRSLDRCAGAPAASLLLERPSAGRRRRDLASSLWSETNSIELEGSMALAAGGPIPSEVWRARPPLAAGPDEKRDCSREPAGGPVRRRCGREGRRLAAGLVARHDPCVPLRRAILVGNPPRE